MSVSGDKSLDKKQKSRDAAREHASADGWKGFVNLELTEAQRPAVKALMADGDTVWSELLEMIASDYKLTVSYDGSKSVWNASLTCRNGEDRNSGLTLTGRGGSFGGAAASLVFKHVNCLNRDWSRALTQMAKRFEPDDVS